MDNVKKTSLGMDENIEAALCYFPPLITGILFLVLEKDSKFVKFNAMQSIAVFICLIVIDMFLLMIPILGWILVPFVNLLTFILIIFLMYKSSKGEKFKLPVIGDFAEKQAA